MFRRTLLPAVAALLMGLPALANDIPGQGQLRIVKDGKAGAETPLKHTSVKAEISGFLARVTVTQLFKNDSTDKIEAVYVFPLPQDSAVDDMTLKVGDRTIRGVIKQRDEARKIYDEAVRAGHVAALLDQERPNIFTQSVANITPGAEVRVTISYVQLLKYEDGGYEFSFPMVVGPRYIPGQPVGRQGGGWAPDTTRVPDASRITPPVAAKGTRAGHDISLEVSLDAGVPIQDLRSPTHQIVADTTGASSRRVKLANAREIPNKDFILRYDVSGGRIEDAVLTHRSGNGAGFFTLILQPPDRFPESDLTPKELVFVLDTSGSMSGFPIEKAKEAMKAAIAGLYRHDTFNLITFAGDTHVLFPEPVPATAENVAKAQAFLEGRRGGGGTEMMKAIRAALDPSDSQQHVRIVCFMTDGYVGNDMEIIGEVQRHPNARVFSFGIGSSVNRFLLDKMAEVSRGEVEYVGLNDDGSAAARRFHERVRSPLLTDISVDWNGMAVDQIYPKLISDLFAAKPVTIVGRYSKAQRGSIKLKARRAGQAWERQIKLDLPSSEANHDVLAKLWARTHIDALMAQDWQGLQNGNMRDDLKKQITQVGLEYRLMTQFTSFVAVEEKVVTEGGTPRTVQVPVDIPEGVSHEGVFGESDQYIATRNMALRQAPAAAPTSRVGVGAGSGIGGGFAGGKLKDEARAQLAPPPPPPPVQRISPQLQAVIECWKQSGGKKTASTTDPCSVVQDGKVRITIQLTTRDGLGELAAMGFTLSFDNQALFVIGTLPLEKLGELAEKEWVRYIALKN